MICQHCKANLSHTNTNGERYIRNRGLVFKAVGLTVICPKCKGDVLVTPDAMHSLHKTAVLFFQNRNKEA